MNFDLVPRLADCSRVGSLPGCLPLHAHDIGQGTDASGATVFFAWGANWTAAEAQQPGATIKLPLADIGVVYGADVTQAGQLIPRRNYAPIVSREAIAALLPVLILRASNPGAAEFIRRCQ
jgi:hypothetical protein